MSKKTTVPELDQFGNPLRTGGSWPTIGKSGTWPESVAHKFDAQELLAIMEQKVRTGGMGALTDKDALDIVRAKAFLGI